MKKGSNCLQRILRPLMWSIPESSKRDPLNGLSPLIQQSWNWAKLRAYPVCWPIPTKAPATSVHPTIRHRARSGLHSDATRPCYRWQRSVKKFVGLGTGLTNKYLGPYQGIGIVVIGVPRLTHSPLTAQIPQAHSNVLKCQTSLVYVHRWVNVS